MSGMEGLANRLLCQLFPNVRIELDDTNLLSALKSVRIDERRLLFRPVEIPRVNG
jgi:hypothetical protein